MVGHILITRRSRIRFGAMSSFLMVGARSSHYAASIKRASDLLQAAAIEPAQTFCLHACKGVGMRSQPSYRLTTRVVTVFHFRSQFQIAPSYAACRGECVGPRQRFRVPWSGKRREQDCSRSRVYHLPTGERLSNL